MSLSLQRSAISVQRASAIGFWRAFAALFALSGVAHAEPGKVRVLVFDAAHGGPLQGVIVGQTPTNRDGAARLVLPPGEHVLSLSSPGYTAQTPPVPVVEGETTEVLVRLRLDQPPIVQIEAAATRRTRKAAESTGPPGQLTARVTHVETGAPIARVRVYVRGLDTVGETGADGVFTLTVASADYDITLVHPDYSATTQPLTAAPDATPVDITLTPAAVELAEFTVTAPRIEGGTAALQDEQRASSAVADLIGAEEMSRAGASDAAGALKRVTGVTIVGGKYVYVRGLGERYSSTLLDGATLPSPEPERRVVPLDMFPAAVLESVVIQKTYSPDMPADFGGGVVQLRTRAFPSEFEATVGLSGGWLFGTTGVDSLRGGAGSTDFLGFDDGGRALPSQIEAASSDQLLAEGDLFSERGYPASKLEEFGELMPNRYGTTREALPPSLGLDASIGDRFEFGANKAGYLAALTYDHDWQRIEKQSSVFVVGGDGGLELANQYDFETVNRNVVLAGLVSTGLDLGAAHQLRLTTQLDRITDDQARIYAGRNRDANQTIQVTRLRFVERQLWSSQARGTHALPGDLVLDWRYAYSQALRDEPDRIEFRRDEESPGRFLLSDSAAGNQRVFSGLEDDKHDAAVDLQIPVWTADLKVGAQVSIQRRAVDTRRYKFKHRGEISRDPEILDNAPEDLFTPETIGVDGFLFEEITRETDNYSAEQDILAGYAMGEVPVGPLRIMAGARVEQGKMRVRTFELFKPDGAEAIAELDDTDVLPAATVTWSLNEDMQLRGGFAMTVNRPDFRELSAATFNDVTGGRQVSGNPDLKRARILHGDLRWSWYLGADELIAISAFYKQFEDPIEVQVRVSANPSVTFRNAEGATNLGAELEARKNFDWLDPTLRDWFLAANTTWVHSQVNLGDDAGAETNRDRPLQGQSPYVFNAQLGYDNPESGTRATLLYNVFGPRITEVGALNAPDVIEQPFHQLDLVIKQDLGAGFALGAKGTNLIDGEAIRKQGEETVEVYRKGRGVSLSVSKSF